MCGQSSPAACREAAHEWVICIRGRDAPSRVGQGAGARRHNRFAPSLGFPGQLTPDVPIVLLATSD